MMTAVTPPTNDDSGFLNTRHDTESADTSTSSPAGRKNSVEDSPPACSSKRAATSKLFCNGHGRMIGAVTAIAHHSNSGPQPLRNKTPKRLSDGGEGLFVWFSDDRRLFILIPIVVLFVFGIIIVVGISRRHRLAVS